MRDAQESKYAVGGGALVRSSAVAIALSAALAGCPVDERTLDPIPPIYSGAGVSAVATGGSNGGEEAGAGGTPSDGDGGTISTGTDGGGPTGGSSGTGGSAGHGGGSATGGSAGTAGSSAAGSAGVGCGCGPLRCPDLDDNGMPDCDESLALNPSFDSNARGWAMETGANVAWMQDDARGNAASGSLGLLNTTEDDRDGGSLLGARQCITVEGGTAYRFAIEVAVPPEADVTYGGFQLYVYDGPSCSGSVLDDQTSIMLDASAWTVTDLTYLTPSQARSVSMRLVTLKPFRSPPAKVLFDNILVRIDD